MRTNFFQAIQRLHSAGSWIINVSFSAESELLVSVLLKSSAAESGGNTLPPMLYRGTAKEIDEGFFESLSAPVEQTVSFFANLSAYQKGLEDAKAKLISKPKEKSSSVSDTKKIGDSTIASIESASIKTKFEDIVKDIAALNSSCKYGEALAILPNVEDYPDKKAEIEKLQKELNWRKSQMTLL
ncbi:PRTRC system protein E [Pedobacter psychrodurus]|uniref:PRTRC system protein E n=1 Tax=Pedobacter psychrodurus TaxID=2530456 RepID=UPI002930C8D8|nr:PRTRC system protein E [Pedobacter psychrodurus]